MLLDIHETGKSVAEMRTGILFGKVQRRKLFGPLRVKTCLQGYVNSKGADQPAHPRSMISATVIRLLESIIS